MRRTHLSGYDRPIRWGTPLLALAAGVAAWEGVSRAPVGQQGEGSGHFLLSASFCLLSFPMAGLLKADTASSMGKSCVMVKSGPGEHILHALKLSQRDQASWVLRTLSAVTQEGWTLPSAGARRPSQKDKTMPRRLLARMAPGSPQPAKAAGWGHLLPTTLLLGQRPQSWQCWAPWCSWKPCPLPGCPGGHPLPCGGAGPILPARAAAGASGLF